jgi:outer membrane protein TolC
VVAQAKEGVAVREAGVKLAKSAWYPTLAAGTDFGLVNYNSQPFNSDWRTNWTLGVTLSLPIFDGFRRMASQRASEAELAAARAQAENATEVAQVEAAQAAAAVAASAQTLETSTRTVGQAQRAYQIAELRFQQGASTHLELVDARVQLEQAQLNQARSSRDLRVARLRQALLPGLPLGAAGGGF